MSKRLYVGMLCAFSLLPTYAFQTPQKTPLPNFDKRTPLQLPLAAGLRAQALDPAEATLELRRDKLLGGPSLLTGKMGAFLTGPEGSGALSARELGVFPPEDTHRIAKSFVDKHSSLFGFTSAALTQASIKRDYQTAHNGLRTVVWEQQLESVPIFQALFTAHLTRRNELVRIVNRFVPDPVAAAQAGQRDFRALLAKPKIAAEEAVRRAAANIGANIALHELTALAASAEGPEQKQYFRSDHLRGKAKAHLRWVPINAKALRLCWKVELSARTRGELYRFLIDAENGDILLRHCLTAYATSSQFRVYTQDSPTPLLPAYSAPSSAQPAEVARELLDIIALNPEASPNGWINDSDNETSGNNVDAHTDKDDDDEPDLPRPFGNPNRVFDLPLDLNKNPGAYSDASVVQLFYWNNFMHDKLYEVGFTEAAGNFQNDNFDRGGLGDDAVQADAQDGGGLDNANMSAAEDGEPGRMQMYLFEGPNPDRDGVLDATVVLHEYTHGLSLRLVGGGIGISALQPSGMGEGWSDFYALSLLSQSSDDLDGTYPAGAYASYQLGGETENYYYGIRRYPYTTDMRKNPLTFKDIDPSKADAHAGVPVNPLIGALSDSSEVHNQGEVWCVTLWEVRAALIRKHGFETGNHLVLQLVTDAMKLSPPDPTFLEERDAIIQADLVNSGGANRDELWTAFAKRGMGFSAGCPSNDTTVGVEESFDVPDDLRITPNEQWIVSGEEGGPFNAESKGFIFRDAGTNKVVWQASGYAPWLELSSISGTIEPDQTESVQFRLNPVVYSLPAGVYRTEVSIENKTTGRAQSRKAVLRIGQSDFLTQQFDTETNSLAFSTFTFTPEGSSYRVCREPATAFATTPLAATPLQIGDDAFTEVTLTNGVVLPFFGKQYSSFFVADNGNLTFTKGAAEFTESIEAHFSLPRISLLFDDLDPTKQGQISWQQLDDRVAITWLNLPEYRDLDTNSFQAELFFDGRIRLTYLEIDAWDGLIGLSPGGGVPENFQESDFSRYGACLPPLRMTLPQQVHESDPPITASVELPELAAQDLTVHIQNTRPQLLQAPAEVTIPAGTSKIDVSLQVLDDTILNGSRYVRLIITADGYATASARIEVIDDEMAALSLALPQGAKEGDSIVTNPGVVTLSTAPSVPIVVHITSSMDGQVGVDPVALIPAGETTGTFKLYPVDDSVIDGTVDVPITASVANWPSATQSISIADNEDTILRLTVKPLVGEGNNLVAAFGRVWISGTLPDDLIVQLSSAPANRLTLPATLTIKAGDTNASFSATIIDDSEASGPQQAAIAVTADRFTGARAKTIINDNEFPPVPSTPFPADGSTNNPVFVNLSWSTGLGEVLLNGDFETGSFTNWVKQTSGNGEFVINDGSLDPDGPEEPLLPFAGKFSIVSEPIGPGHREIAQEITLPKGITRAELKWNDRIDNFAGFFLDSVQQFRVEIRDSSDVVLSNAFAADDSTPTSSPWTERSFDLLEYAGQTIRIAFIEESFFSYLNVHLDNISIVLDGGPPDHWDVYFANHDNLSEADLLGSTPTNHWELPNLALETTYYWKVIAHLGAVTMPGPEWQFTVPGIGPLEHFAFEGLDPNLLINVPREITIRAEDALFNTVTNFQDHVTLSSQVELPATSIGAGKDDSSEFLDTVWEDSRLEVIYLASEIGSARRVTGLALNISEIPGERLTRFTIRMKHTSLTQFSDFPSWDRTGWATVYQSDENIDKTGWRFFEFSKPFDYNGLGNLMVDFTFNNKSISFGGALQVTSVSANRSVAGNSDSTDGDPLTWSGTTPFPFVLQEFPNIQFESIVPIQFSPVDAGPFTNGIWTGPIQFQEPRDGVRLSAIDSAGHRGDSDLFNLTAENDLVLEVTEFPNPVTVGFDVAYDIQVKNTGPLAATSVTLTNRCGTSAAFVSGDASIGTLSFANGVAVAQIGTLEAGSNAVLHLIYNPGTFTGRLTNICEVVRAEPDGYPANNSQKTITQINPKPRLSVDDAFVYEDGPDPNYAEVTVNLSLPASVDVSVQYSTANGTAVAGQDFVSTNATLVIPAGKLSGTIRAQILDDLIDERDETFTVRLSNPLNCIIGDSSALVTILDDDGPDIIVTPATVVEGNKGYTNAIFTVRLSAPSVQDVTLHYFTIDGTASAPADYVDKSGDVFFSPGQTSKTISVQVRGDLIQEPDETFSLLLYADGGNLKTDQVDCTILNDDGLPGDIYSLAWSPIPSPQYSSNAFAIRLTALDKGGHLATNFTDSVALNAFLKNPEVAVGKGHGHESLPIDSTWQDFRTETLFLASEVGEPRIITGVGLNILSLPTLPLTRWTIRMKPTALTSFPRASWDRTGWTTVYQTNLTLAQEGWTRFDFKTPFQFDGTNNLLIDFSYNNSDFDFSFTECEVSPVTGNRTFSGGSDSENGDPLLWSGTIPLPEFTPFIPNLKFFSEPVVPLDPAFSGKFVNGVWDGFLGVNGTGDAVTLRAADPVGHEGFAAALIVLSGIDSDGDLLPDAWELAHGLDPKDPSDALADPDQDGVTSLEEFRSGTDPSSGASALTITRAVILNGKIHLEFTTVAGHRYQIQQTPQVDLPWQLSSEFFGRGGTESFDDQLSDGPMHFYRLLAP